MISPEAASLGPTSNAVEPGNTSTDVVDAIKLAGYATSADLVQAVTGMIVVFQKEWPDDSRQLALECAHALAWASPQLSQAAAVSVGNRVATMDATELREGFQEALAGGPPLTPKELIFLSVAYAALL